MLIKVGSHEILVSVRCMCIPVLWEAHWLQVDQRDIKE